MAKVWDRTSNESMHHQTDDIKNAKKFVDEKDAAGVLSLALGVTFNAAE